MLSDSATASAGKMSTVEPKPEPHSPLAGANREIAEAVRIAEEKVTPDEDTFSNRPDLHGSHAARMPDHMDGLPIIHTEDPSGDDFAVSPSVMYKLVHTNWFDTRRWPLYRARRWMREYFAEFWGTFVLIFFGDGVCATVKFTGGDETAMQGTSAWLCITIGWGFALVMGLYVSMGISGGHLNPAVTFTNAVFGAFPWNKVLGYMLSQVLGAMVAAACVYALFKPHIDEMQRTLPTGTTITQAAGGIFCTYGNVSHGYAFLSEFLNTAVLMMGILGINDENMTPAIYHKPMAVGMLILIIGLATGWNTGYAINPARDFGPRTISAMLWGKEPFTLGSHYFVIPLFVPFAGAIAGGLIYTLFIVSAPPDELVK